MVEASSSTDTTNQDEQAAVRVGYVRAPARVTWAYSSHYNHGCWTKSRKMSLTCLSHVSHMSLTCLSLSLTILQIDMWFYE
eukprot:COSAG06_NODE_6590_length_2864_cov_3.445208_1_plen_81_part_00